MTLSKKFDSLDTFYAKTKTYQLLPFNFIRLDTSRYVVTNLVGEFVIISDTDLRNTINKKLQIGSKLYNELISKHFIYDSASDAAIDLLSLKYRTKAHAISRFTGLHIFVVTLRCDYSCPYCQVSRQCNKPTSKYDMSEEMADKYLDFVFMSPSKEIKIEFQGGEPLLNFNLIKYIVIKAKQLNENENRNLEFVIATNLTFINDDILDFCLKHNIYISTSLDGPHDLHNKNRPRPGKNGFNLTVQGIKKVKQILGDNNISALMTTSEASLSRYKDIIDTYIWLGFKNIFLRPLSPYGFAVKTKQLKYDTSRWLDFYRKSLDYILEINKQGYFLIETHTAIFLNKLFSSQGTSYVDIQSPAGIGLSVLVYNYDGDVYASDEARMLAEMNDYTFKLGNIFHDSYEDIISSDKLLNPLESSLAESSPMCSECGFLPFCGSDPVYHYATQRDYVGNKAQSGFCQRNMGMLRHIVKLFEDDKSARKIFLEWIK